MDTKKLRQKILDLAIRGKLVPQDPNDEPASVLLERIREEKKQMVKEGKLKAKDIKNDTIIFKGEDNLHYEKFQDGTVKCIEDEIPFEVPDGWEWTRIFSISNELPYGTAKKSEPTGKVIVFRMGNIQNGEVDYSDLVYSSDDSDIEKYNLTPGDLLFNRTNSSEWVGKTSIYRGDFPAIYAGYIIRLRTPLNPEYLNSVMNSSYAYQYCRMVKTDGVNQSNINAQKLGAFLVPVAPKAEQIMIANKISDILPQIDSITECKTSLEETVSYVKSKVLDLAIRGKLVAQNPDDESASVLLERIRTEKEDLIKLGKLKRDKKDSIIYKGDDNSYYEKSISGESCNISEEIPFELPEAWTWCRLKTVVQIINGDRGANYPAKNKLHDSGIPFVSASNIDDGIVSHSSGMKYLSEEQYNLLRAGLLQINDIVYCIRGSLGKCGIFPYEKGAIASSLVIVRPYLEQESMTAYLMLYLASTLSFSEIKKYDNGTAQPNLAAKDFENFLIPLPPLKMIAKIVCKATQLLDELSIVQEAL